MGAAKGRGDQAAREGDGSLRPEGASMVSAKDGGRDEDIDSRCGRLRHCKSGAGSAVGARPDPVSAPFSLGLRVRGDVRRSVHPHLQSLQRRKAKHSKWPMKVSRTRKPQISGYVLPSPSRKLAVICIVYPVPLPNLKSHWIK